jgi:signal transduction histidine kinase
MERDARDSRPGGNPQRGLPGVPRRADGWSVARRAQRRDLRRTVCGVWRTRIHPFDLWLAAAFGVFGFVEEQVVGMEGAWWPYALAAYTALVAVRRVWPLVTLGLLAVHAPRFWYNADYDNYRLWQLVALTIASYTVGRALPPWSTDRLRWVPSVLVVLGTASVFWLNLPDDPMGATFFTLAPAALGAAISVQARRAGDAAAVRASLREQQARDAVMEERVRIARELHDMVAHSVTVMVIQAGVVRRRHEAGLGVDPELLLGIEAAGREAVGELRRTLGLLRGDGTAAAPVGLERLDELIAQVREAGLTVTVERAGEPRPVLPAVDMSAYRIVQEALTNVLKHAGSARATVSVGYRPDGLHLAVRDEGGTPLRTPPSGGGQGLIGMRERVALFDGELVTGPRADGGFEVVARLPLAAGVSS